jgi:large subunit ribosomal protein L3
MIPTIKGEKLGMTSVFDGAGTTLAVTLVRPYPAVVTQIKTPERDGYSALQLAYGETAPKHVNRPVRGIFDRAGVGKSYARFYEIRLPEGELNEFKLGQEITPAEFLLGWAEIDVGGNSKGKGFAGGVKRWGFRGQCRSHGDPDNRRPQSSGATDPARVFKGARRPGQMGNAKITVKHCVVFEYYRALNVLVIQGSVPGPTGAELTLTVTREFTPEELAEHDAQITLDEKQAAMLKTDEPEAEVPVPKPEEPVEAAVKAEEVEEPSDENETNTETRTEEGQ